MDGYKHQNAGTKTGLIPIHESADALVEWVMKLKEQQVKDPLAPLFNSRRLKEAGLQVAPLGGERPEEAPTHRVLEVVLASFD